MVQSNDIWYVIQLKQRETNTEYKASVLALVQSLGHSPDLRNLRAALASSRDPRVLYNNTRTNNNRIIIIHVYDFPHAVSPFVFIHRARDIPFGSRRTQPLRAVRAFPRVARSQDRSRTPRAILSTRSSLFSLPPVANVISVTVTDLPHVFPHSSGARDGRSNGEDALLSKNTRYVR